MTFVFLHAALREHFSQSQVKHVLAIKFLSHVIKELVHAFSCAYIKLWMNLGSLESSREDIVALGYRVEQILLFFRALQNSSMHPQLDIRTPSMTNSLTIK